MRAGCVHWADCGRQICAFCLDTHYRRGLCGGQGIKLKLCHALKPLECTCSLQGQIPDIMETEVSQQQCILIYMKNSSKMGAYLKHTALLLFNTFLALSPKVLLVNMAKLSSLTNRFRNLKICWEVIAMRDWQGGGSYKTVELARGESATNCATLSKLNIV